MTLTRTHIPDLSDVQPQAFYEVETVGAAWQYACDTDLYFDETHARTEAIHRDALCPDCCTRILVTDLAGGTSLLWQSRPDPDADPDLPLPPPRPLELD